MSEEKSRYWMAYLLVGLYYGWFIWSASSHRPVEVVSRYLPGWVATLIWASWLFFFPIMGGVFNVAEAPRLSLAVLFLISTSLLPITFRFYPGTTVLVWGAYSSRDFGSYPSGKNGSAVTSHGSLADPKVQTPACEFGACGGVGNGFAGQIALEIGAGAIWADTDASDSLLCFILPSRSVL
jgi:hypothetical protein